MDALNFGVFQSQISELPDKVKQTYSIDFMLGSYVAINNGIFAGIVINSGSAVSSISALAKNPGIVSLKSAASTVNSGYKITTTNGAMILGGGETGRVVFYLNTITNISAIIGFHNSLDNNPPTNGVYFNIVNDVVKGRTAKNSSSSETGTEYSLASNAYYCFAIDIDTSASTATFKIYSDDQSLLWSDTLSTNMPTGALGFGVNAWTTASDEVKYLLTLDYMEFTLPKVRVIPK